MGNDGRFVMFSDGIEAEKNAPRVREERFEREMRER